MKTCSRLTAGFVVLATLTAVPVLAEAPAAAKSPAAHSPAGAADLLTRLYPNMPHDRMQAATGVQSAAPPAVVTKVAKETAGAPEGIDRAAQSGELVVHPPAVAAPVLPVQMQDVPSSASLAVTRTLPQGGASSPGRHDPDAPVLPAVSLDWLWLTTPHPLSAMEVPLVSTAEYAVVGKTAVKSPAVPGGSPAAASSQKVDVNRADAAELARKLKIDARRARLIIEFRQAYGPFKEPADVAQVFGITDEMLQTWENGDQLVIK